MNPSAEEQARLLKEVHHDLTVELTLAQEPHKELADNQRAVAPGMAFTSAYHNNLTVG